MIVRLATALLTEIKLERAVFWISSVLCAVCAVTLLPGVARADNPIVQTIYTADPAPLVHNGRVYLYTGHDEDGSTNFTMKEWRVWSSADMVNWTDHGSPLSLANFSWASANAWAGQAIFRNGKFYWYVPMTRAASGRMAIGVGVSDDPTGPFIDALGHPLVEHGEFDPTVFIDSNGQAYLYWGNPDLWYVTLNADMISFSGSPTQIRAPAASSAGCRRQRVSVAMGLSTSTASDAVAFGVARLQRNLQIFIYPPGLSAHRARSVTGRIGGVRAPGVSVVTGLAEGVRRERRPRFPWPGHPKHALTSTVKQQTLRSSPLPADGAMCDRISIIDYRRT
jgi:hypothetical protein